MLGRLKGYRYSHLHRRNGSSPETIKSASNIMRIEDIQHQSALDRLMLCFIYKCINFVITMMISSINARSLNLSRGISFDELLSFITVWGFCLLVQFAGYDIMMNYPPEHEFSSIVTKNFVWITYAMCGSFVFVPIVVYIYHFSKMTLMIITIVNVDIILSLMAYICTIVFYKKLVRGANYARMALVYYSIFCFVSFGLFYYYCSLYYQSSQQQQQQTTIGGYEISMSTQFGLISSFYAIWLLLYVNKIVSSTDDEARWKMSLLLFWLPESGILSCFKSLLVLLQSVLNVVCCLCGYVLLPGNSSNRDDTAVHETLIPMHECDA